MSHPTDSKAYPLPQGQGQGDDDVRTKLELFKMLEDHAVSESESRNWAALDLEILALVRRVLGLRPASGK